MLMSTVAMVERCIFGWVTTNDDARISFMSVFHGGCHGQYLVWNDGRAVARKNLHGIGCLNMVSRMGAV